MRRILSGTEQLSVRPSAEVSDQFPPNFRVSISWVHSTPGLWHLFPRFPQEQ